MQQFSSILLTMCTVFLLLVSNCIYLKSTRFKVSGGVKLAELLNAIPHNTTLCPTGQLRVRRVKGYLFVYSCRFFLNTNDLCACVYSIA